MASTGVNVLRWSALGAGIAYGFYHKQSLKKADQQAQEKAAWAHKESLISQAKAEWAKTQAKGDAPQKASAGSKDADLNVLLGITDKN